MQKAPIKPVPYYIHGDRQENWEDKDLVKFWCVSCELFMEAGHFDTIKKAVFAGGCNSIERFVSSAIAWKQEAKLDKSSHYYRQYNAYNLFDRRKA